MALDPAPFLALPAVCRLQIFGHLQNIDAAFQHPGRASKGPAFSGYVMQTEAPDLIFVDF